MSSSTSDEELRYFGWLCESAKSGSQATFDVGIHDVPLDKEALAEFDEIVGLLPRIRPTFINFLVLREDFRALHSLPAELLTHYQTQRFPVLEAGIRTIETHVAAERRISAFLNSASAFRDRLLVSTSDPAIRELLEKKISQLYDNSFAYRLCYNLRNYSQHRAHPLHIIPVNAAARENGELEYRIDLEFERDRLIAADSKFQPKVKSELASMSEKIPVLSNCTDYFRSLRELFFEYLSLSAGDIHVAFGYEAAVRSTVAHMPKDATPMLFHGKPVPENGEFKCKTTSFSFDELNLLKRVLFEAWQDTRESS